MDEKDATNFECVKSEQLTEEKRGTWWVAVAAMGEFSFPFRVSSACFPHLAGNAPEADAIRGQSRLAISLLARNAPDADAARGQPRFAIPL